MDLSIERLSQHLPHYLTAPRREGIQKEFAQWPNIKFWYLDANAYPAEVMQGDCWNRLSALDFATGARRKISGVVLSNSCDVDPANKAVLPQQLVFVPLLRVATLEAFFLRLGHAPAKVAETIATIRRQGIDSFFFFPKGAALDEDRVAWLDQVHTMPLAVFLQEEGRKKAATLSDPGFYLFAYKLSIYFCRLHEDVDRSEGAGI